jgi:murein DD-endopeptidase MepM/ murein hydrolase activator NlpD
VPLDGQITKQFSTEVPIYSPTLDQYVIHTGIDIQAPADTQVLAAGEGTVTKVYNDDKYGITIEISHGNGIVTKYSNLSTTKMVEEGDVVKKGQTISGVGSSALFESLEAPHLHFEVLKDGVAIDPGDYIR